MKPLLLVASFALILTACTPAQIGTDIALAGQTAPVVCAAVGGGSACGPVATDVGDVAKLVQDILDSLPKSPAPTPYSSAGTVGLVYRGVTIALPASLVPEVQARLGKQ
jgi:hypothetical protein